MNTEVINEGNRLIAEFMGNTIRKDGKIALKDKEPLTNECIVTAKYHSSWDWLMPVVERIIYTNNDQSDLSMEIMRQLSYAKIKPVYDAVIDFIKFYNTQQTQTT